MKALIFDMDGVILNSEPINTKVCVNILKKNGINVNSEYFDKYLGIANPIMWEDIKKEYEINKSVNEIIEIQEKATFEIMKNGDILESPNLKEFLSMLKNNNIPCAIASSSPQELINIIVDKLEIKEYLQFWISAENFNTSKPDPKIFIETAKRLGIEPKDIIVIEDSENGIKAAKRAGMKCIAYSKHHIGTPNMSEADYVINDFSEILKYEKLKAIFNI